MCERKCVFDNYEEYLTNYLSNSSQLAVLLDYDGTLSPLVAHPDLAKIPPETKSVLDRLSKNPNIFLAIISGRNVDNVKQLAGLDNITYAGNHGLDVLYPDGTKHNHELPANFKDQVAELKKKLEHKVVRDGAWIEDKGSSLTFHFRAVPEKLKSEIETTAFKIIEQTGFKISRAHEAIEARPKVDCNKGTVALMIMEQKFGATWPGNVKVIFAGDDNTDEDAMKALKGNAATFRVASSAEVQTHAVKLLSSTESVLKMLKLVEKLFFK